MLCVKNPAFVPDFVMHMQPGRTSGRTHKADLLPEPNLVSDFYLNFIKMTVTRLVSEAVIDLDEAAISAVAAGARNGSRRRRVNRCVEGPRKISAGMKRYATRERVEARTEP